MSGHINVLQTAKSYLSFLKKDFLKILTGTLLLSGLLFCIQLIAIYLPKGFGMGRMVVSLSYNLLTVVIISLIKYYAFRYFFAKGKENSNFINVFKEKNYQKFLIVSIISYFILIAISILIGFSMKVLAFIPFYKYLSLIVYAVSGAFFMAMLDFYLISIAANGKAEINTTFSLVRRNFLQILIILCVGFLISVFVHKLVTYLMFQGIFRLTMIPHAPNILYSLVKAFEFLMGLILSAALFSIMYKQVR